MNRQRWIRALALSIVGVAALRMVSVATADEVTLINDGKALVAIYATAEVLDTPDSGVPYLFLNSSPAAQRHVLRDSVRDLARTLEKISGAKIPIVAGAPADDDARLPILIGELAAQRFGTANKSDTYGQGFHYVVAPKGIGLAGESDRAVSYAIYELLHRLGCRWFIPSEMGEVLPQLKTVTLTTTDEQIAPYTHFRKVGFADDDYQRRNRLGGQFIAHGHALEGYISEELRKQHPEWQGFYQGKPYGTRLKWSAPGVPEAMADSVIRYLDQYPGQTVSLSPDDGLGYDDTEDRKLDANDFDPAVQGISISDRQVWLCNKIIDLVNAKHPGAQYGMLAYAQSIRPPVREKVHPQLIPIIAPITYSRAHPMKMDCVPDNSALRYAVVGWGKATPQVGYYLYSWLLAEPSAPCPFITKWAEDLKFIYEHGNCRFWTPESLATYDTNMHNMYLGMRMAWDPKQDPYAIIDDLHEKFYGQAAKPMAAYWHYVDRVWTESDEYSGAGFGHLRRWTPQRLAEARTLLDLGRQAAATAAEKARIQMTHENLNLFEQFMALRRDLAEGRFKELDQRANAYVVRARAMGKQYFPQYAFGGASYLNEDTWYANYFGTFYQKTYDDAARIARQGEVLTPPLRQFRFQADKEGQGEQQGWQQPAFDDTAWRSTDTAVDTWSSVGHHSYMGRMWYRATVQLPKTATGKKVYLWIGATDGTAKVFVNGRHVPYADAAGKPAEQFSGFAVPASFDFTSAVREGENHVAILCQRLDLNELGTGGILASPLVFYQTAPDGPRGQ